MINYSSIHSKQQLIDIVFKAIDEWKFYNMKESLEKIEIILDNANNWEIDHLNMNVLVQKAIDDILDVRKSILVYFLMEYLEKIKPTLLSTNYIKVEELCFFPFIVSERIDQSFQAKVGLHNFITSSL